MTRLGALFWVLVVVASGFTTFKVKYAVQDVEDQLSRVRKQTIAEQQEIRVLTAEWTYLNQPERLADLNRRFLQLGAVTPKQLQQRVENIPLRAPAAPADPLVAAVAPPPASAAPAASPLPIVPAALTGGSGRPQPAARLAKGGPPSMPASFEALVAQVAGEH